MNMQPPIVVKLLFIQRDVSTVGLTLMIGLMRNDCDHRRKKLDDDHRQNTKCAENHPACISQDRDLSCLEAVLPFSSVQSHFGARRVMISGKNGGVP